jgi:uncharacterized protein (UPF0303 family)
MTTGGFTSAQLAQEERVLTLPTFSLADALAIGEIAVSLGMARKLPLAIELRMGEWVVFHAALPGSNPENDGWIARKAQVVLLKKHSTMYERVLAEEEGLDWYEVNGVSMVDYAIHGGGLPLHVTDLGFEGILLISGLPQVEDHLLGVEILTEFLARKGEVL